MSDRTENLFYHPSYLDSQKHDEVRLFEDDCFRVFFSIEDVKATSLSRGLFGSFEQKQTCNQKQFSAFANDVILKLGEEDIQKVEVVHPPEFYKGFVMADWLSETGFSEMYADTNHHIELANFRMHQMELRKLEKLRRGKLEVRVLSNNQLSYVYNFLAQCRNEKGLELNISFEKLEELLGSFPERYSMFGAFLRDELMSAVIMVQVNEEVVYYYLPATLEAFRKESPMVGLIDYVVDYFKSKVKYIDLGISSEQGKPQTGLIAFKDRMGGIMNSKRSFTWIS